MDIGKVIEVGEREIPVIPNPFEETTQPIEEPIEEEVQ